LRGRFFDACFGQTHFPKISQTNLHSPALCFVIHNAERVDDSIPPQTWRHWLEARARPFLLFARDQTRCEADAHDVLQEALVEAWQRQGTGNPPPDGLVFATIRRRAIDLSRRIDRRARREADAAESAWFALPEAPPFTDVSGLDDELSRAVTSLPAVYREVVVLKVWSGLTFQQIADTLAVPLNTATSRYRYALEHLRDALAPLRDAVREVRP
jgi:RNA polymerase sigma-70 factor (ECF subfamily)